MHYFFEITVMSGLENCHVIRTMYEGIKKRRSRLTVFFFFSAEFGSRPSRRARLTVGRKRSKKNGKKFVTTNSDCRNQSEDKRKSPKSGVTIVDRRHRARNADASRWRRSWSLNKVENTNDDVSNIIVLCYCAKPNIVYLPF